MAGKGKQTIGYWYWMTVHMGLGRGPVNGITEIVAGDRTAWEGHQQVSGTIQIDAENLFGGEEREGGIVGPLEVLMGEATQVAPSWFKTLLGGLVPDYRGIVSCIFDGKLAAMNPYPKPWKFRRWRTTADWFNDDPWEAGLATILLGGEGAVGKQIIRAMNPAHIIYECCTNPEWGRGLPATQMGASFAASAQILYDEKFGLCLNWAREDDISPFIQHVVDTIGAALYVSRVTGKIELDLIRGGYDPDGLMLFDYESGLLSVEEDTGNSQDTSFNEIIVQGHDPITDEDFEVRSHNIAAREAHGSAISTTAKYPGIPTRDLAARVADRDLLAQTSGLKPYTVKVDRRGWRLTPGGVFRISAPDRGIENLVLRIGTISEPDMKSGEITLACLVDVFSLRANSFHDPVLPQWRPPSQEAVAIAEQEAREASYRDLTRMLPDSELSILDVDSGYIYTVAALPSSTAILMNYTLATRVDAEPFQKTMVGQFAPSGRLAAAITPLQTVITLEELSQWESDIDYTGMAALLGDEYVRIDAYDTTTGVFTIGRGCVDTLPIAHSAGERLYIVDDEIATDGREYATGETVFAKLLTNTTAAQLSESGAATMQVAINQRASRPYPPGNVLLNGMNIEELVGQHFELPLDLTWTHRDRLLQDDQLVDHGDASVGPEAGVTYTVEVYATDAGGFYDLVHTEAGITGTSFTYDLAEWTASGEPVITKIELYAMRDGLRSRETYEMLIDAAGTAETTTIEEATLTIEGEVVDIAD